MENKEPIALNEEERARMAKLYEQVSASLKEMALITARVLQLDPSKHAPTFERRSPGDRQMTDMSIEPDIFIRVVSNFDGSSTGCYSYAKGLIMLCGGKPGGGGGGSPFRTN
jgi:hypothetical protein